MKKTLVVLVFFLICSGMIFAIGLKKIRGVELKVIDAETDTPLPNICVYYLLIKSKVNFNIFVPGDSLSLIIKKKKLFTNENGIVYIKNHSVFLGLLQGLSGEKFYINIDVNNNKIKNDTDETYYLSRYFIDNRNSVITIPNVEYFSAAIYNFYNSADGYVIFQKNTDEKFEQDEALSDLQEKNDIKIVIRLPKVNNNSYQDQIDNYARRLEGVRQGSDLLRETAPKKYADFFSDQQ